MDNNLNLLYQLQDDVAEIKGIVIKNSVILEEHARRSTASEGRLELLEQQIITMEVDHKARERALTWALGTLGALGTIFGIIDVIHNLLT